MLIAVKKFFFNINSGIVIIFLFFLFTGCSTRSSNTKVEKTHHVTILLAKLNSPFTSPDEKKSVIEQIGYIGDKSAIPELKKILLNNNESFLWMTVAETLKKLGIENAVEAQKEYEMIKGYEKDYYYIKTLDNPDEFSDNSNKYQRIINAFSSWLKKFPDHPKSETIKISLNYFREMSEKITIEKVYNNPKKYISIKIQWQGIIKEINMRDNKVEFMLLTGDKKWYALVEPGKFIAEIHKIGTDIKILGEIIEYRLDESLNIPVVYMRNYW
ncbi:hypothetical protein HY745_03855 [Candidatus Desantisbacteria bacterium]|nr:hypothetical protein [Candidatus Desantisbacteria bacterium]